VATAGRCLVTARVQQSRRRTAAAVPVPPDVPATNRPAFPMPGLFYDYPRSWTDAEITAHFIRSHGRLPGPIVRHGASALVQVPGVQP